MRARRQSGSPGNPPGPPTGKMLISRDRSRVGLGSARVRTTRACDSCRQRKAKCNGEKPVCGQCAGLQLECVYSEQARMKDRRELDMLRAAIRRQERAIQRMSAASSSSSSSSSSISRRPSDPAALPNSMDSNMVPHSLPDTLDRALALVHVQLHELGQVYQAVHDCDPAALPSVVSAIRRSASVHEAATRLTQQMSGQRPGITLERMQRAWLTRLSGKPELVSRQPSYSVSTADIWTSVVGNAAASHLFSLFFVWDNPTWHVVEPGVFLDDFHSGRTRFCSSLLVHAILFYACHLSYDFEKPWDRRDEMATAKQLLREIERLWQLDHATPSLPTVQASLLLGAFFCAAGKDKIGTEYVQYGARMALHLGLHTSVCPVFQSPVLVEAERNRRAHKIIAGAVYDLQTLVVQLSRKPTAWPGPPELFLSAEEAAAADIQQQWAPYPFTSPVHRPFLHTSLRVRRDLLIIVNDVASLLRELDGHIDLHAWQRGAVLHQRLVHFERALPPVLGIQRNRTPHNLCFHMYHHMTIVNLCGLFMTRDPTIPTETYQQATSFHPPKALDEAMDALATLILLYRVSHGWKSTPIVMVHYFLVAGVHAASHLESSKWREVLVSCVSGLWHMGLVWRVCRAFLRTIQLVLKGADPALMPAEAVSILKEFDEKVWNQDEVNALGSIYVVHHHPRQLAIEAGGGSFQGEGLEDLIRSFERLDTEDPEDEGGRG
ncbi:hypothetical protein BO70DRAFT_338286 [Aspergillus heteromorphus CBS 117.55]|uniref:Zn(2)-C6 fungal-type domain-containing protein n=1 Tax=Aspergillus heteromorphus CBS 117.55 TaxID=1448321 RepID=A0A317W1P6_9EURO|nr:uncharacterized protein BO70DRAFT_338286 [Aspergillus heteromorphus CBS 117.55]PWY79167.1 hypothetical protein BO70DRAFT_338286 [Aspergillus heteromorphus CBS 117.55]